jgi:hypothetical protein
VAQQRAGGEPAHRVGDHVRWLGQLGVVLRVVELGEDCVYEIQVSGMVAVAVESELQRLDVS